MIDFCRKSMENKNRGKKGIGMKRIKKKKVQAEKTGCSGVRCDLCSLCSDFAGKAVSGVAEQKSRHRRHIMKRITRKKSMTVRWCALMPATAAVTNGADYAGTYEKDETLLIARLVKKTFRECWCGKF